MGEAQETMWRLVEAGAIGRVRVAYAEVNGSRIESWHPHPEPFYRIGPFADIGVYPLTILTAMFGPARRVTAFGTLVYPDRRTTSDEPFSPASPDFGVAVVELENGTVVRLTANFYVGHHGKQKGIELHGDTGSIFLSSWQDFDATVELARFGEAYEAVPVENAFPGTDWARALDDLSDAIVSGRPHRATGAQAAHIVEILDAVATSAAEGRVRRGHLVLRLARARTDERSFDLGSRRGKARARAERDLGHADRPRLRQLRRRRLFTRVLRTRHRPRRGTADHGRCLGARDHDVRHGGRVRRRP